MDKLSQEKLSQILAKEKSAMLADEVSFLKARKSYLTKEQVEKFLAEEKVVKKATPKKSPSKR